MNNKMLFGVAIGIVAIVALILVSNYYSLDSRISVQKFGSEKELTNYLDANLKDDSIALRSSVAVASDSSAAVGQSSGGESKGYSGTNNQVDGVDEADFVKNDGEYIYISSNQNITIVRALPADEMQMVSVLSFEGYVSNIFVNDDKMVVFGTDAYDYPVLYGNADYAEPRAGTIIAPYQQPMSFVRVYDISSRENPEMIDEIKYEGSYRDARMIGDYVYLIANQPLVKSGDSVEMPLVSYSGVESKIAAQDVSYLPVWDYGYQLTTIFSINLDDSESTSASFLTGYTQTIYVSENAVYLTAPKYVPYQEYNQRMYSEVFLASLKGEARENAERILESEMDDYGKDVRFGEIIFDYYNELSESDKEEFSIELTEKMADFQNKWQEEMQRTTVYKISIDEDEIEYVAKGDVPGYLLNQFAMDENNGYLRVATTSEAIGFPMFYAADSVSNRESGSLEQSNGVYVLDKNLEIVGEVTELARGERIYSARFIDDRVYLVTFKQVDPLFVIDLSDPENPEVLGELKIPGFSTYLHPYDEDTIIGIGQDTSGEVMEDEMRAIPAGLKIALFDVSDPANPRELDREVIGDMGSYSSALYDHHAFFFDSSTGIMVIPVSVQEKVDDSGNSEWYPTKTSFQGAYIYDLDDKKIDFKARVTHLNASEQSSMLDAEDYYYPPYDAQIQRTVMIGDSIYTISQREMQAHGIEDFGTIGRVELPTNGYYLYAAGAELAQ